MNIIRFSLRKPIAVIVAVIAIVYFSLTALRKINVDIFPKIELPAIYIAMPYGGLTPAYMDGFMADQFQKVLIFVDGVKGIDFKSVQGFTLMKLTFYPGTNMAQAAAEVSTQVSRAMAFLPPGAVPPQVVRFDGSSLPMGQLVFESKQRSITELQNLALTRIRPMFVNIAGVTGPAPFGGNIRTIVVNINPQLLQAYHMSPQDVTVAIAKGNLPAPAGNIRIGNQNLMAPVNSMAKDPAAFLNIPIRSRNGQTVFIKDVATVSDAADQTVGYAIINGKRSVYLPVVKKADASTLTVVKNLKNALPMLKAALPPDVNIKYVFDQSAYIQQSLQNLLHEGLLGALLTGLVVLLFLKDVRGALIVVLTIPIAILSAILLLYAFGQTINIMTMSGLALAIGILVDEATVTIENIHQHTERRKPLPRAVVDALLEISLPKLLILLCILAVLTPSLLMTGIPKDMFLPLSLAVAFAMIASFLASQSFVPIIANWLMKPKNIPAVKGPKKRSGFERFRVRYAYSMGKTAKKPGSVFLLYAAISAILIVGGIHFIGTDIMPPADSGDLQLRIEAPTGSRLEVTEHYLQDITNLIKGILPDSAISISSAYVGTQPSATAINPIFLFTGTSGEAVLQLSINKKIYPVSMAGLKEQIRRKVQQQYPELKIDFEPMELMEKIMNQGAMTPIEIKVAGRPLKKAVDYANKIKEQMQQIPYLRDVRIAEPLDYPSLQININRELAAQFGLTMEDVTHTLIAATSSTRFTNKSFWVDPKSGLVFQVQVQIPESDEQSLEQLRSLPLKAGEARPLLDDVATFSIVKQPAQINRQGPNRYVTIIANTFKKDLGTASADIDRAIKDAGTAPRGVIISKTGSLEVLKDTLESLQSGLVVAIVVIFLMLAAYYQSFKLPLVILSVVPAVAGGSLLSLLLFGSTLNLQSYMGLIMSMGVSVSNAVLLVNQAEQYRKNEKLISQHAAQVASASRLRPIVMTTVAMIAGMIPMALGLGEGGGQVAPLGQAVIGGLLFSTIAVLGVLPTLFGRVMKHASITRPSLDPDDPGSRFTQKDVSLNP